MKLVRFGDAGQESPGILLGEEILDVRAMTFDIEDYDAHFFTHWGLQRLENLLKEPNRKTVHTADVRLGSPVATPSKIICVGENYAEHAREFGHEPPELPILFSKATSSIIGPNDTIRLPDDAQCVDSEVELAVVIGKTATKVRAENAMQHLAGFTILNDVSERVVQRQTSQWFRAKGFDTFCPIGPWLATPDEIADPQNLNVCAKLNGETLQQSNTSDMIFSVAFLIEFISAGMTLLPGDIIATGTPPGIGSARKPAKIMQAGATVELEIEGLGSQTCNVE